MTITDGCPLGEVVKMAPARRCGEGFEENDDHHTTERKLKFS
jgi:hypothetical protein